MYMYRDGDGSDDGDNETHDHEPDLETVDHVLGKTSKRGRRKDPRRRSRKALRVEDVEAETGAEGLAAAITTDIRISFVKVVPATFTFEGATCLVVETSKDLVAGAGREEAVARIQDLVSRVDNARVYTISDPGIRDTLVTELDASIAGCEDCFLAAFATTPVPIAAFVPVDVQPSSRLAPLYLVQTPSTHARVDLTLLSSITLSPVLHGPVAVDLPVVLNKLGPDNQLKLLQTMVAAMPQVRAVGIPPGTIDRIQVRPALSTIFRFGGTKLDMTLMFMSPSTGSGSGSEAVGGGGAGSGAGSVSPKCVACHLGFAHPGPVAARFDFADEAVPYSRPYHMQCLRASGRFLPVYGRGVE